MFSEDIFAGCCAAILYVFNVDCFWVLIIRKATWQGDMLFLVDKPRINLSHLHHRWSPTDHREFYGKQADADELHV